MLVIGTECYTGVEATRSSWRSLRNVTWVWGPLGGLGDCFGALHGCGGH